MENTTAQHKTTRLHSLDLDAEWLSLVGRIESRGRAWEVEEFEQKDKTRAADSKDKTRMTWD